MIVPAIALELRLLCREIGQGLIIEIDIYKSSAGQGYLCLSECVYSVVLWKAT